MASKNLWLVDDHPNDSTLSRLELVATLEQKVEIKNYCGTGWTFEFVETLARGVKLTENDFFILDVFMPIPPDIKPNKFWGRSEISENYCGFAMARWLVDKCKVNLDQISVCSAHKDVKWKIGAFEFEGEIKYWEGWQNINKVLLRKWMKIS